MMRALLIGLLRDEARREQEDVRDKDQVGRAPAGAGLACEEGVGGFVLSWKTRHSEGGSRGLGAYSRAD